MFPDISTPSIDESIWVLNFKRKLFKDQLKAGNWTLSLKGKHNSSDKTITLTDDSKFKLTGVSTPVGKRYNILSGSNGNLYEGSVTDRYGWFYPEVGIMVFGEKLSNDMATDTTPAVGVFNAGGNQYNQIYPRLDSASDAKNSLRFINCLKNVGSGNCLTLYGEQEVKSITYACRFLAEDFNFTSNSTIISSSGRTSRDLEPGRMNGFSHVSGSPNYTAKDGIEYTKGDSTMDGNPHSFVSYVHLYDTSGIMVAIGSLSTPLMKNVTKEGIIKVRLDI